MHLTVFQRSFGEKVLLKGEAELKSQPWVGEEAEIHLFPSEDRVAIRLDLDLLGAAALAALAIVHVWKLSVPAPEHLKVGFFLAHDMDK